MADLFVTFYCAKGDLDALVAVLRTETGAPVHVAYEQVFGHDFGDARTAEQVRGSMDRAAVTVIAAATALAGLVAAVTAARRTMPVRWHAIALAARGRIE